MRTHTSANWWPTSKTTNLEHRFSFASWGTLFVTMILSNALALILSIASPVNTPCVIKAYIVFAPSFFSNLAARYVIQASADLKDKRTEYMDSGEDEVVLEQSDKA